MNIEKLDEFNRVVLEWLGKQHRAEEFISMEEATTYDAPLRADRRLRTSSALGAPGTNSRNFS